MIKLKETIKCLVAGNAQSAPVNNSTAFMTDLITFIFGFSQFSAAVRCYGHSGSRLHAHARFHRL